MPRTSAFLTDKYFFGSRLRAAATSPRMQAIQVIEMKGGPPFEITPKNGKKK